MIELVNKYHPDKLADRIAGAIVDLAYTKQEDPQVAVEVLLGHGECNIIAETSVKFESQELSSIVERIAGPLKLNYKEVRQDEHLAKNQSESIKCGDNGIFSGLPTSDEELELAKTRTKLEDRYQADGKYILTDKDLIICQSNAESYEIYEMLVHEHGSRRLIINPLGEWTGGSDVDSGATNRKLGSDMGDAVTGGGLHGKDLSKADVSVNIYCHLLAQETGRQVKAYCAIGDARVHVDGRLVDYSWIVENAREYIKKLGGFEKFAEYGLIRG